MRWRQHEAGERKRGAGEHQACVDRERTAMAGAERVEPLIEMRAVRLPHRFAPERACCKRQGRIGQERQEYQHREPRRPRILHDARDAERGGQEAQRDRADIPHEHRRARPVDQQERQRGAGDHGRRQPGCPRVRGRNGIRGEADDRHRHRKPVASVHEVEEIRAPDDDHRDRQRGHAARPRHPSSARPRSSRQRVARRGAPAAARRGHRRRTRPQRRRQSLPARPRRTPASAAARRAPRRACRSGSPSRRRAARRPREASAGSAWRAAAGAHAGAVARSSRPPPRRKAPARRPVRSSSSCAALPRPRASPDASAGNPRSRQVSGAAEAPIRGRKPHEIDSSRGEPRQSGLRVTFSPRDHGLTPARPDRSPPHRRALAVIMLLPNNSRQAHVLRIRVCASSNGCCFGTMASTSRLP